MTQEGLESDIIEYCQKASIEELFEIIKKLNDLELELEGE